ncbi:474_t:CDS:1, partial [Funneliformis geosporum]
FKLILIMASLTDDKEEIEKGIDDEKNRTRVIALAVREAMAVAFRVNQADWDAACRNILQNHLLTVEEKTTIIALLKQRESN